MTDIRKFAVEETSVIPLLTSDESPMLGDDGQPMTITVYGPGSKVYAKAKAKQNNRLLDKLKKRGKTEQSAEERTRENADFLAECTKEFSPNIECDGKQGESLFKAVYGDLAIGFIADQVAKHLEDWANFTKGSTKP